MNSSPHLSPIPNPSPRLRRQQLRACDFCHRRKVRCDSENRQNCSNCKASGLECRYYFSLSEPISPKFQRTLLTKIYRFDVIEALSRTRKNGRSKSGAPQKDLAPQRTGPKAPQAIEEEIATSPRNGDVSVPSATAPSPTKRSPIAQITSPVIEQDSVAKESLVQFFRHGIRSQSWTLFDDLIRARMCYIGTPLSNLSHLVHEERCNDSTNLHYPIPPIRRAVSWKPDPDLLSLGNSQYVVQDLASFPVKEVRDALVESFFNDINPGFPVVDEAEFRIQYEDKDSPPPLLLYHAVLLAGAHACQHRKVVESRPIVKAVMFRRAKTLFDLRYENDRAALVQAALLFSWHVENADSVSSNSYHWIKNACSVAFGLGMHRDLTSGSTSVMPKETRRMFRRLWWTVFQAEVMSSLDHGRPLMINPNDVDQPPLTEDDFIEIDGRIVSQVKERCVSPPKWEVVRNSC
jgi:transcriptional regulatory protein AMDR